MQWMAFQSTRKTLLGSFNFGHCCTVSSPLNISLHGKAAANHNPIAGQGPSYSDVIEMLLPSCIVV